MFVCLFSAVCVCEQFVVAKKGIEKKSKGGDAEALANIDEAVVLEADWVRDSTAAHPGSPLTFPRVCVFTEQVDLASLCSRERAIGAHRPPKDTIFIGFEDHRLVHIGQRLRVPALAPLLDALLSYDELLKGTNDREQTSKHQRYTQVTGRWW